jgi:hypothetical protein
MQEATHAVAVRVRSDDFEAAIGELHERIVPRASNAPGFVHGYWTRKDDAGLAMILFDSEDGARGAMEQIRTAPPGTAELEDVEVREVVAQA